MLIPPAARVIDPEAHLAALVTRRKSYNHRPVRYSGVGLGLVVFAVTVCAIVTPPAAPLEAAVQVEGPAAARRPNVVLILADDMGYSDIGPYGASDIRTPHLDRLADEGVRLTNAYATAPVCTPSRIALLTGRYQQRAGFEGNVRSDVPTVGLSASEPTVSRMLSDSGYATALFGKWHLGFVERFMPNAHGFDEFFGFLDWSIDYYSHRTPTGLPGLYENTTPVEQEGYSTDLFTERAVSFIDRHANDSFFLTLAYNAALPPYQPPGRPSDIRTMNTWQDGTRQDYIGVVEALDSGVGRVLDALDRHDVAQNTLVIFAYDHGGEELARNAPLAYGFGTLWDGGIRVPCLLRWPSRLAGGITSTQVISTMDLTASILTAAGVRTAERQLDGIDLIPILSGEAPAVERTLHWRFGPQRALRRGAWKYLALGRNEMLFNLSDDLGEQRDLSAQRPELVAEFRALHQDWEREVTSQP